MYSRWITELEVLEQGGENIVMTLQNAQAKEPTVVIIDAGKEKETRKKKARHVCNGRAAWPLICVLGLSGREGWSTSFFHILPNISSPRADSAGCRHHQHGVNFSNLSWRWPRPKRSIAHGTSLKTELRWGSNLQS